MNIPFPDQHIHRKLIKHYTSLMAYLSKTSRMCVFKECGVRSTEYLPIYSTGKLVLFFMNDPNMQIGELGNKGNDHYRVCLFAACTYTHLTRKHIVNNPIVSHTHLQLLTHTPAEWRSWHAPLYTQPWRIKPWTFANIHQWSWKLTNKWQTITNISREKSWSQKSLWTLMKNGPNWYCITLNFRVNSRGGTPGG